MKNPVKINLPKNTILKPADEAGFCSQSFYLFWWSVRESNPRPRQCECRALSAELTPHELIITEF